MANRIFKILLLVGGFLLVYSIIPVPPRLDHFGGLARKEKAAAIAVGHYQQALEEYLRTNGSYPVILEQIKPKDKNDPWGRPFRYHCEDRRKCWVTSDGPDSVEGSSDDISSAR